MIIGLPNFVRDRKDKTKKCKGVSLTNFVYGLLNFNMADHLFYLLTFVTLTSAHPWYQTYIPNGANVPSSCQPNTTWPGVGHQNMAGGGDRNPFGLDFAANNYVWTLTLCNLDSDGDGLTNGQELGDPNCTWSATSGIAPQLKSKSHPGICEPLTSPKCLATNQSQWMSCKAFSCPAWSLPTTKNISLTLPVTPIPVQQTTYMCQAFNLPNDTYYHIIGLKPLLNNTNIIHHMLVYGCPDGLAALAYSGITFTHPTPCLMGIPGCETLLGIWSIGIDGACFSDEYGIPMGPFGVQYAVLQVHWNNANEIPDQFDSSGLMLFYTSQLRPNNGQILMIGQENLTIPPNQASVSAIGRCMWDCTQFMPYNVSIAAAVIHMHLLGKSGDIQLISGSETYQFLTASEYDYNAPTQNSYDPPISFSPGDELRIDCLYQSLGKNTTTVYGPATTDEMCYGFMTIYPAIKNFDRCNQYGPAVIQCGPGEISSNPYCTWDNFELFFFGVEVACNGVCNQQCKNFVRTTYEVGCLNGSFGANVSKWIDLSTFNMCAPAAVTATTKHVTSLASTSSSWFYAFLMITITYIVCPIVTIIQY